MKSKLKSILIFSVFILSLSSVFLYEEASATKKDLDVLYEKAKSGISDLSANQMEDILGNVELQINKNVSSTELSGLNTLFNNSEPDVQTYATAEILESNGDTQFISISAFSDITLNESELGASENNNGITPLWSGDLTDSTSSVRAYATLNIEAKVVNGHNMLRLLGGSGGWTIIDSRVKSITNRYVSYANVGSSPNGAVDQNYGPYSEVSNSFDRSNQLNLYSSSVNKDGALLSTTLSSTLSSSLTSWNFKMVLRNQSPASAN